ncbi:MAG: acireductone dioxygenase [Acidobacteria bacterium]|nr:MAG: acireductone dioxygenase [Acidobacteriota bacterium]
MAVLRISEEHRTISGRTEVAKYLETMAIDYDVWKPSHPLSSSASQEEILEAYSTEIEKLKAAGGYVTADVINVNPQTPNLDAMLAKFSREHWHDEDEVRFVVQGRGLFHVNPKTSPVVGIEVEPGDLIRVPRGTLHWFDLCSDKQIRCIRLFQDPGGWTPWYTDSGVDEKFEPVCFGRSFVA